METRKNIIKKTLRGLLWMLVLAGMVVALLAAMNRLPSVMQKGFLRQYDSIEEAKGSLGLDNVTVPSYFPEGITWPPSLILAQTKPFKAIVMEFRKVQSMETALIVVQSFSQGGDERLLKTKLSQLKEETRYRLKERTVLLQVGACDHGTPCSRLAWQNGDRHYTVLLMSSPVELIRIAESMIH